jgi:DNA primase
MSIFSFIKQKLSILDVVSEYITLKKAGHYYKGCCPFHHEKTASFTVSPHKEICYCFGCHVGGDVIAFISRIENCTQIEAAKLLAEKYQLELPEEFNSNYSQSIDEKKKYFKICELMSQWCHDSLVKSPAVLRYLYGRGIDKECIEYFNIGYFPGGLATIKALLKFMSNHHILADDLIDANILSKGNTVLYSPYEERIMFPITDHLGHYCGFGGRIYKKLDTRAKYYNSRENEFFNKGSLLYGLDLAKESMQKKNALFLVEGYTDCIAMVQHGYKNSVAILGTACTLDHLKKVARYVDYIYVVYDGDKAGQQAILRLAELCWQVELEIKIIQLPTGEDPASCLAKKIDLAYLIRKSEDIFHFFIQAVGGDFSQKPLSQKLKITRKIIAVIGNISDPLKQDILLQEASKQLEMPYTTLKNELQRTPISSEKIVLEKKEDDIPIENININAFDSIPKLEKKIFSGIINDITLLNEQNRPYIYTLLPHSLTNILKIADRIHQEQPDLGLTSLFDQMEDTQKQMVSHVLLDSDGEVKLHDFERLVAQLQKKHWKTIVNDIKIKLENAKQDGNQEQIEQLIHEFSALKQKMLQKE